MRPDPKSTAGILLREHDSPAQALAYAERKAQTLGAMQNAMALDYDEAARQIRAYVDSLPPWSREDSNPVHFE